MTFLSSEDDTITSFELLIEESHISYVFSHKISLKNLMKYC